MAKETDKKAVYDTLNLIKKLGKYADFSPRMIQLLDHYINYTRAQDWEEGRAPIVFQSVYRTAMQIGVSDRQLQRLEKQLHKVGALTWKDSGNHKRHGQRDPKTGNLIYAFGVDLSPLRGLKPKLEKLYIEKTNRENDWLELKRKISAYRGQIRRTLQNSKCRAGGEIATNPFLTKQIRSYMSISALKEIIMHHQSILSELKLSENKPGAHIKLRRVFTKVSGINDKNVAHIYTKTYYKLNKLKQQRHNKLQNISAHDLFHASSKEFQSCNFTNRSQHSIHTLLETAYSYCKALNISQTLWARACNLVGRKGAIVVTLFLDHAINFQNRKIKNVEAYFYSLIEKTSKGELYTKHFINSRIVPLSMDY